MLAVEISGKQISKCVIPFRKNVRRTNRRSKSDYKCQDYGKVNAGDYGRPFYFFMRKYRIINK